MRAAAGLFLLLFAACSRPKSSTPDAAPPAPAGPPAPAADEGSGGRLTLVNGTVISLLPIGPGLISVSIREVDPPTPETIELERHVVGEALVQVDSFGWLDKGYRAYDGHSQHVATPGTTYAYRARLGPKDEWTTAVEVRTAAPKLPPPPPEHVDARPFDRYSIVVGWKADVRAANGIEIQTKRDGKWIPAGVVAVDSKMFFHQHLLPKSTHEYRIATFNEHGKSAFVESGATTTPETIDKHPIARPPPPCTKLPREKSAALDLPRADLTVSGGPTLISDPAGGGVRRLFGRYRGCLREMGTFELQGDVFSALEWQDDGFPLLRGIRGAGEYAGAQIGLFAFADGRYAEVNVARFCGMPRDAKDLDPKDPRIPHVESTNDVTAWRGPFEVCQLDFPR